MTLRAAARLNGELGITTSSVFTILDEEAKRAEREAARTTRDAIRDASPVGPGRGGKHLRDQYRFSVRRTAYGYVANLRRLADGWYGRIVENGRHAGFSPGHSVRTRGGGGGWHYPAAEANPYVERTATALSPTVLKILEGGGLRVATRINTEIR